MPQAPVRVLVADDSALMRRELTRILECSEDIEVVGVARNGAEALQKAIDLNPDVVLLDINMPVMDGLTALQHIMIESPRPCLMVSSLTQENTLTSFEALELGAVDVVGKPSGTVSRDIIRVGDEIRFKVKSAAKAALRNLKGRRTGVTPLREPIAETPGPLEPGSGETPLVSVGNAVAQPARSRHRVVSIPPNHELKDTTRSPLRSRLFGNRAGIGGKIVVIGQSTGGPRAIVDVLSSLPADLGAPIIVVQHMPGSFTGGFARRLSALGSIRFKEAETGDVLEPNCGFVAPGDLHLVVAPQPNAERRYLLRTSRWPTGTQHSPSVDVTMRSVLERYGLGTIGVLLTGMGDDGAAAMVEIREAGGRTIAESEETAIVFGMPREAIRLGGAEFVLPSYRIGEKIVELVKQ